MADRLDTGADPGACGIGCPTGPHYHVYAEHGGRRVPARAEPYLGHALRIDWYARSLPRWRRWLRRIRHVRP